MADSNGGAVVTGGGAGIGRALALRAGRDGYRVAILDIDAEAARRVAGEIAAAGGAALAFPCDISLPGEAEAACAAARAALPELKLVFANAGVAHLGGLVTGAVEGFDWIWSVNVTGMIATLRALVPPLMAAEGERHVVVSASMAGLSVANARTPAYAASKYAVLGLAEALRAELADSGVAVTIACPGTVNTRIWDGARVRPDRFGGAWPAPEEVGARHRATGADVDWVAEAIWAQMAYGGGYVTPVPNESALADFERRCAEVRASFRLPVRVPAG